MLPSLNKVIIIIIIIIITFSQHQCVLMSPSTKRLMRDGLIVAPFLKERIQDQCVCVRSGNDLEHSSSDRVYSSSDRVRSGSDRVKSKGVGYGSGSGRIEIVLICTLA